MLPISLPSRPDFCVFIACIFASLRTVTSLPSTNLTAGTCCAALDSALPGKVHFNDLVDLAYETSQLSFWSAQEQSLQPTCIVIPTSSQDVSVAIGILNAAYSNSTSGCQFAVRGAGHTPWAGAANIDGGITLDLQSLNQVTVSADQTMAGIGPGNRWGNVYSVLDPLNLSMVGGRVSDVGVAGLVTGGGVSFFSGRYGFACDNVLNYEVVLSDGTITNANRTSNSDLYRALKGGSNNFAIVTRFDVKVFEQPPFWGGTLIQPIDNKDDLFDFIQNFTDSSTYDPYSALISNFEWTAGIPAIINDVEYGKPTPDPPAFGPLFAMPQIANTMRVASLSSFTNEIAAASSLGASSGKSNILSTMTFKNNATFMSDFWDLADATAKSLADVVGLVFVLTYQPLPYEIYSKSTATGGNVLGLDRFKDDFINGLLTASWALPTDDDRIYTAIQQLFADGANKAKAMGLFNEFVYLNYAAQWEKPITGYGPENKAFLQQVSKKYDPQQLYQIAKPGGFTLAKS